MANPRDAMITGIGLVSSLGEGLEAHWAALNRAGGFQPVVDDTSFAPFLVHPMIPLELDRQIPKRGDQRQMEPWQRIGTYAAGLALDRAGVKGNGDLLSRMDMIVAAGGGERDYAVDTAILSALPSAATRGRSSTSTCCRVCGPPYSWRSYRTFWLATSRLCMAWLGLHARSWAKRPRALTLSASPARALRPGRAICSWSVVPTTRSGRTCCCTTRWGRCCGKIRSPVSGRGRHRAAACCWARWAVFWWWRAGNMPRRAPRPPWRTLRRSPPIGAGGFRRSHSDCRPAASGDGDHLKPGHAAIISGASGVATPTGRRQSSCADCGCLYAEPPRRWAIRWNHRSRQSGAGGYGVTRGRLFAPLEPDEAAMAGNCGRCW